MYLYKFIFIKVLGKKKKEFRQFLKRRGKTHKVEGNKALSAEGGAQLLGKGDFRLPHVPCPEFPLPPSPAWFETACSPLIGAAHVSSGEPTTFRLARPLTGSPARGDVWKVVGSPAEGSQPHREILTHPPAWLGEEVGPTLSSFVS